MPDVSVEASVPMTPDEFARAMSQYAGDRDMGMRPVGAGDLKMRYIDAGNTERRHIGADSLMCDLLRTLGYGEGVDTFENMPKWYA